MRKVIGPGLAVVPTFEDMLGNPPAVQKPLPALKYIDIMENPLYQSLFNSFRTIETSQELIAQKQLLNVTITTAAANMGMSADMVKELISTTADRYGDAMANRLFLHMRGLHTAAASSGGGPPPAPGAGGVAAGATVGGAGGMASAPVGGPGGPPRDGNPEEPYASVGGRPPPAPPPAPAVRTRPFPAPAAPPQSYQPGPYTRGPGPPPPPPPAGGWIGAGPVSYTHLTLPTKA